MMRLTGSEAEDRAVELLKDRGYRIVARNWRCRFGEIDIVARDGPTLVFVEVKARSGDGFGGADGAVDKKKQGRLATAAGQFLQETGCELPARFDVVAFSGDRPTLLCDAFSVG